jgi:2-(1,2-epoxy-1,2-dihydrophenyl)acetyl-CoA isomerase
MRHCPRCSSAKFIQPFVRIGIMPDCGGIYTLPRLVGSARARALAMLAPTLSAERFRGE